MTSPVWYSAKYQLSLLTLVGSLLAINDVGIAYSFVLGSLIYIIPNLYFVHYAFRYSGAEYAPLIARSFSSGESGKLVLAALGFILVYRFVKPIHSPALFVGFSFMIVLQWFVAAKIVKMRSQPKSN
ncbi:ATP synthase subunit I [Agarilytica rhodophyticola]|uniref:ATP synthase subunit I n=1 Tax=Agarilytica rhodophyticola TaxID=1737490 RepID=UPI001FE330F2|nr:ATP synthase subunit I [Agarilytica rhodophyticola]